MCGSIVDIQSPTAEIKQGKNKDRKKSQGKYIRATIKILCKFLKFRISNSTKNYLLTQLFAVYVTLEFS